MNRALFRNPIALAFLAILALILVGATFAVVPETKQALVVRFGEPKTITNRFQAGERFGETGAGVIAKLPFVDEIIWIDKRIQSVDMDNEQVISSDQLRLVVDAFARYRIVDPLQMYIAARNEENVQEALRPILVSALRNELGQQRFTALLSPERGQVMQNIRDRLNRVARQYGAQIIDVRIKRADLPGGGPLESAFQRMRTDRLQEAAAIEAQGQKQAQIIRADADAQASRIYAQSYGKDADFFDFYRAMESYRRTFVDNGEKGSMGRSNIVLSPQNDYLRRFSDGAQ